MTSKQPQRVVLSRARPVESAKSAWNRPLPRWANYLLGLLVVLAALIVLPNIGALHVYEKHFRGNAPEAQVQFEALSADMDEAAVRARFKTLSLRCELETSALGNRVCFSALSKANGNPALTLALFFKDGHLRFAILQVPWWAHGRVQERLYRQWGSPGPAGTDGTGRSVLRWQLPGGHLEMNKTRYLSPLTWSVVLWTANKA